MSVCVCVCVCVRERVCTGKLHRLTNTCMLSVLAASGVVWVVNAERHRMDSILDTRFFSMLCRSKVHKPPCGYGAAETTMQCLNMM